MHHVLWRMLQILTRTEETSSRDNSRALQHGVTPAKNLFTSHLWLPLIRRLVHNRNGQGTLCSGMFLTTGFWINGIVFQQKETPKQPGKPLPIHMWKLQLRTTASRIWNCMDQTAWCVGQIPHPYRTLFSAFHCVTNSRPMLPYRKGHRILVAS